MQASIYFIQVFISQTKSITSWTAFPSGRYNYK